MLSRDRTWSPTAEADMLKARALKGPKRVDKAPAGAVLTSRYRRPGRPKRHPGAARGTRIRAASRASRRGRPAVRVENLHQRAHVRPDRPRSVAPRRRQSTPPEAAAAGFWPDTFHRVCAL